jgi:phosphosulfolactate synthase (CoM biosynthesis protein A)
MGHHIDGLKFAGGSFSLFPEDKLRELIDLAHEHGVYVSTVCIPPKKAIPITPPPFENARHPSPEELTP